MALNRAIKIIVIIFLLQYISINIQGQTPTTKPNTNSTDKTTTKPNTKEEFLPQNPSKIEKANPSKETSTFSLFLKSFFILLLLLLILYAILKFIQKRKLKTLYNQQDGVIQVLKNFSIAPNKSIQLVEIAKDIYILGLGDNSISTIEKIVDPTKIENIKKLCEDKNIQSPKSFSEILGNYFGGSKISIPKRMTRPSFGVFDQEKTRLKGLENKF